MIWVGGGILVHGMEVLGFAAPAHWVHHAADVVKHATGALGGVLGWMTTALLSGLLGLAVGAVIALAVHRITHRVHAAA
jgi:predicted DNA repair protein MutK